MFLYFALYALLLPQALPPPVPATKQTPPPAALVKLRLDTVKTTAFNVKFFAWGPVPNGEPSQFQLDFVADYAVQVQRPNRVRVLDLTATWTSTHVPLKDGSLMILPSQSYVSDGEQQLTWSVGFPKPIIKPFAAGEGDLTTLEQTAGPHVLFPAVLFTPNAVARLKFKYYGEQVINSHTVAEYRSTALSHTTVLYLNRQTHLPERVSTFRLTGVGDWTEMYRADFSDWKFDVLFAPDTFDLKKAEVTLKPYVSRK